MVNNHNSTLIKNLFLISLFLTSSLLSAEVSTTIDRNPVRVNETFELTLHMESAPITRPPLEGLPEEFEIIRSTNFYNRSTVNGKTETQAGWQYVLRATVEGIFTIPGFKVDGATTNPFQISVMPAVSSTSINGQQDAIKLTATVDHEEVYVQQQILYTVRLYRAVQAQYASLTDPMMEGAILERLGEDKQFESEIEGVRYIVLERQYVLFPQSDGLQSISPVTFTAEVSNGTKRYSTFGQLRSRTKAISLSTDTIDINVKGRPMGELDWWLPANDVTLTEQWSPEPLEYRVGEPVTWSYTIKASGLTSTQLPELLPTLTDGLKFYPDTATSDNQVDQFGISGLRTQKIAVLPTKAGTITLPELKLTWWDVKANKTQTISLPSRNINILASLDDDTGVESINDASVTAQQSDESIENDDTSLSTESIKSAEAVQPWKMIAIISLLLWVISALVLTLRNKQSSKSISYKSRDKQSIKANKTEASLKDIKLACKNNSAQQTKIAILSWCSTQRSFANIHSLAELARHTNSDDLKDELTNLERKLYSKEGGDWNGDVLYTLLNEIQSMSQSQIINNDKLEELPPLHLSDH